MADVDANAILPMPSWAPLHNDGNIFSYWIASIAASLDATEPVITNMTPTPGTVLADRFTGIEFDITDDAPGLNAVMIWIEFDGHEDVVLAFNGTSFMSRFAGVSSRTAIAGGWHFVLAETHGWRAPIKNMWVVGFDGHGNIEGGTLPP